MEPHEQLLLEAIRDDPDDVECYAVYGDWLAQEGDPRGELIGLSLALEREPADDKLAKRVQQLIAEQTAALPPQIDVTWRRGFVDEIRFSPATADLEILRHPLLRLVGSISLVDRAVPFKRRASERFVHLLDRLVNLAPPTLRRLEIGDRSSPVFAKVTDLQAVLARFPRLVELALWARTLPAGTIDVLSPRMHAVELASTSITETLMRRIAKRSWPHLRALSLHVPRRERSNEEPSPLAPLMNGAAVPRLVDLRLHEHDRIGGLTERFCMEIVKAPLLARLEVLDFAVRDLDVDIVRPSHPQLRHLKKFLPSAETETDIDAIQQLAYLLEEPDTHRAIALTRKVRDLARSQFDLHNINRRLGTALSLVGKLDEALAALDASLDNEATCGITLVHKAWTLKRMGRLADARVVLESAALTTRHPPSRASVIYQRASLDAADGLPLDLEELEEARVLFVTDLETRVVDADVHYELACLLALMGNTDAALDTLAATLELCPHYRAWAVDEIDFRNFRASKRFESLVASG